MESDEKINQYKIKKYYKKAVVFGITILFAMSVIAIAEDTIYNYYSTLEIDNGNQIEPLSITWDIQLYFDEDTEGASDWVMLGEATDANDGPPADAYDEPKPPAPFPPCIYSLFDDNLDPPYDLMLKDYREYNNVVYKQWNLSVQWMSFSSGTDINITWNPNDFNNSEYDSVILYYVDSNEEIDMLTNSYYEFSCPQWTPQEFKINCTIDIDPPEITDNSPSSGETGDDFTFNATVTDDYYVGDELDINVSWSHGGPLNNISMVYMGNNYFERTITLNNYSVDDLTYNYYAVDNAKSPNANYTLEYYATISDDEYPKPLSDDTTAIPTTGDPITFGLTITDNIDIDYVYANYRWNYSGTWSGWTTDVSMSEGGSNDWTTSGITVPEDTTGVKDVEYYFEVDDNTFTVYVYNGSLLVNENEATAQSSPFSKPVDDNDAPTVIIVASDTAIYDGDVGAGVFTVTATYTETMDSAVTPTVTFSPTLATTLTNPSGVWSVSDTVYTWTYDIEDAGVDVDDVDVTVDDGEDLAGNAQVAGTEVDYIDVDTLNPTVTIVASDTAIYDGDVGAGVFTVTATYTETMDSAVTPTVTFSPTLATTLTNPSGVWSVSDTVYTWTYDIEDAGVDVDDVDVTVDDGEDLAGNAQVAGTEVDYIDVDTLNPTVTIVASDTAIYDGDVGAGVFTVTATYTETMDSAVTPTVTFSPTLATTLTNPSGVWSVSDTVYTWTYDIEDAGVDVDDVDVTVDDGEDLAGNAQVAGTEVDYIDVDTLNPTVTIVASDTAIYDGDVGAGVFTVTATYTETMDSAVTPTVTFSPTLATTLTNPSGVWSVSDTVYTWTYDIEDAGVDVDDVDVTVDDGEDLAGNAQVAGTEVDYIDVDTLNPTVTIVASDTAIYDGDVGAGVFTVTATYTETMDSAVTPTVTFSPTLATTLTNPSGVWSVSDTVYTWTYDIEDAGVDVDDVDVTVDDGEDLAGNAQVAGTEVDYIDVDTLNPTVTTVTPTSLADSDAGTITITITFNEDMDTGVNPLVTVEDLASSSYFTGNPSWSDQTHFTCDFTFIDDDEDAIGHYHISGADDVAGNTMAADNTNAVDVDTLNPTVIIVASDTAIYDGDVGAGVFTVTATYTETMDSAVTPTVTFSPTLATTLTNPSGVWSVSDTVYTWTYDIEDAGVDVDDVDVTVDDGEDLAGNAQVAGTEVDYIDVDTLNPTVTIVASDTAIYDGDVGAGVFTVTATYTETMDSAVTPTVTFSPTLATTLTNPSGVWSVSDTVYTWTYDIEDAGVDVDDVDVTVDDSEDLAGNAQVAGTEVDYIDVDTLNPTVIIVASDTAIYDGDVGAGVFTVTATYTETMDSAVTPTVTFSPTLATTLTNPSGVWSVSDTVYTWTYDIEDAGVDVDDVDVTVDDGEDLAGNAQVAGTEVDYIDVDTLNPTVTIVASDTAIYDGDVGAGVFTVTATYTETMDSAVTPTVTFSPTLATTLTNPSGVWSVSDTVYTWTYDIEDAGVDVDDVDVTVDDGEDLAGNAQVAGTEVDYIDVDTLNPTPSISISTDPIYESALIQTVTVTYDEVMDSGTSPVITFTSIHFSSNSDGVWGVGDTVWTESFTHDGTGETIASEEASIAAGSGATDVAGNDENADSSPTFVLDTMKPTIANVVADPPLVPVNGYINISCDITDAMGINAVNVTITGPTGFTSINTSMSQNGGNNYYYYDNYSNPGDYNFSIWADDISGNVNNTATYQFEIVVEYKIRDMFIGWNFISVPFNQSINKTNLFVINNSIRYNWSEATSGGDPILDSHIYGWDGSGYVQVDVLEGGKGYWVYSYEVCELWATNISYRPVDGYITELTDNGWNSVGPPVNYNISKSKLIIYYSGTEYNWTDAVDLNIVDDNVYYYNGAGYQSTDQLIVGESHWLWSYEICLLRWDTT